MSANPNRPKPPENFEDEALFEWVRVCDDLASLDKLATADRAVLTLYCQTWATYQKVTAHVTTYGPVLPLQNNVIARSPFYTAQRELAGELARLLVLLGLHPSARKTIVANAPEGLPTF